MPSTQPGYTLGRMKKKTEGAVFEFLSKAGRKGGQAVVKKYGKKQLREWGKRGGGPPKKKR